MSARADEIQSARVFSPDHTLLPQISYQSFTYPGDQEALASLKRVPGLSALLTFLQENFTEQVTFVQNNEQMIRAGERSFPSIHRLVARCAEILSCPLPEVYVTTNPTMNAYTVGHRRTCIVIHTSLIDAMTADELSFVVGHELGHIKCGHSLYRQVGDLLLQSWDAVSSLIPVPGIGLIRIPLLLAFWEWFRRAELTCDRAGLLCLQATQPAQTALGKLAGRIAGLYDEFDIESAIVQSQAHNEVNKLVLVASILRNAGNTHPFVPARLKQIREYSESAEYHKILGGNYERDPLGLHEAGVRIKCQCGEEVNSKLNFCPKCGRSLEPLAPEAAPVCSGCGLPLDSGANFCAQCGARQDAATSSPPESRLKRLTSKATGFIKRSPPS